MLFLSANNRGLKVCFDGACRSADNPVFENGPLMIPLDADKKVAPKEQEKIVWLIVPIFDRVRMLVMESLANQNRLGEANGIANESRPILALDNGIFVTNAKQLRPWLPKLYPLSSDTLHGQESMFRQLVDDLPEGVGFGALLFCAVHLAASFIGNRRRRGQANSEEQTEEHAGDNPSMRHWG